VRQRFVVRREIVRPRRGSSAGLVECHSLHRGRLYGVYRDIDRVSDMLHMVQEEELRLAAEAWIKGWW
jgi:hypothetical protein